MSKDFFFVRRPQGEQKKREPKAVGKAVSDYLASNEPLAVAYREHLFQDLFPDTHPCVDLKVLSRQPAHMGVGQAKGGTLVRRDLDKFVFIPADVMRPARKAATRTPIVFQGGTVNVHRLFDGTYRPQFARPRFYKDFTFHDFCLASARELLTIARLIEEGKLEGEKTEQ